MPVLFQGWYKPTYFLVAVCLALTLGATALLYEQNRSQHHEMVAAGAEHRLQLLQGALVSDIQGVRTVLSIQANVSRHGLTPSVQRFAILAKQLITRSADVRAVGWATADGPGRMRLRQIEGEAPPAATPGALLDTMMTFDASAPCAPRIVKTVASADQYYLLEPAGHTAAGDCSGYVLALVDLQAQFQALLERIDMTQSVWRSRIQLAATPDDARTAFPYAMQFTHLGATWQVSLRPQDEIFRQAWSWAPWIVLAAGLFMTLLLGRYARRNIAETRERERNYLKIEELLSSQWMLFDQAPDGVLVADSAGRIVEANRSLCSLFGYTRDELCGQPVEVLLPEALRAGHVEMRNAFFADSDMTTHRMAAERELVGRAKGGRLISIEVGLSRITIEGDIRVTAFVRDVTARQRAEQQASMLAAITDATSDIVSVVDCDGRLTYLNRAGRALLGCDQVTPIAELHLHASDLAPKWAFEAIQQEGVPIANRLGWWRGETALLTRDKREIPVSQVIVAHHRKNGVLDWTANICRDISGSKAAEAELRRLALVAETTDNMVVITDTEGCIEWVNPTFSRVTGYSLNEVIGRKPGPLMQGPESDPGTMAAIRDAIAAQRPIHTELVNYTRDGRPFYIELEIQPVFTNGKLERFIAIERDISERKRTEQALVQSETRLAEAQRVAHIGSWELDLASGQLNWSHEVYRLFGMERGKLEPSLDSLLEFVHPLDRQRVRQAYEASVTSHTPFEITYRTIIDMGVRHIQQRAETQYDDDGAPLRTFGTVQDITERVLLEQELRQLNEGLESRISERTRELEKARIAAEAANRAKSAFLATMSHEIRTPLHAIIATSELLEGAGLRTREAAMVERISNASQLLLQQISDILDLSKIEAGQFALEQSEFRLAELLETQMVNLYDRAQQARVRLMIDLIPEENVLLRGDAHRLQQILVNLIGNAIKFTGGRPQARVGVRGRVFPLDGEQAEVVIKVIDNGVGIDADTLPRIWDRFTQADDGITRQYGGSGLGLAIVHQLVELMHGRIMVGSSPGEGTVFTLRLTLPIISTELPPLPDLSGLRLRLLTVKADCAEAHARWLRAAGAVVVTALPDSWSESRIDIPAAAGLDFDVAIVDLQAIEQLLEQAPDDAFAASVAASARHVLAISERRALDTYFHTTVSELIPPPTAGRLLTAVADACGRLAAPATEYESQPVPMDDTTAGLAGHLLLVAEDNPVNQAVICEQLSQLGYRSVIAADGQEALERLQQNRHYALLLTDVRMPRLDGFGLARAIRHQEWGVDGGREHLPIIAITADATPDVLQQCAGAGIDEHLTKPIKLDTLRSALERWLPPPKAPARTGTQQPIEAPEADSLLDPTVLLKVVGDDPALHRHFLGKFLKMAPSMVAEIETALDASDLAAACAASHKLKSSARTIGAHALADACYVLEQAGKAGDQRISPLAVKVQNCWTTLRPHLEEMLK